MGFETPPAVKTPEQATEERDAAKAELMDQIKNLRDVVAEDKKQAEKADSLLWETRSRDGNDGMHTKEEMVDIAGKNAENMRWYLAENTKKLEKLEEELRTNYR